MQYISQFDKIIVLQSFSFYVCVSFIFYLVRKRVFFMLQETARTGILQKDKETVALIPEIKFGLMTPDDLEKIARCFP